jgi:hypothetical protein
MKIQHFFLTISIACLFSAAAVCQTQKPAEAIGTTTKTDPTVVTSMTVGSFMQLVQGMGFECSRGKDKDGKEDDFFIFQAEGYKVIGAVGDGYIQLAQLFSPTTPPLSAAIANDWNKSNVLSRAYIDNDKNSFLSSELIISGGVTRENIQAFVKTFRDHVARWARIVRDQPEQKK